jgi:hypothetical protein
MDDDDPFFGGPCEPDYDHDRFDRQMDLLYPDNDPDEEWPR